MPRKRKTKSQISLPSRWALNHGAYYYRVPPGQEAEWDGKKWFKLGRTVAEAYSTWYSRIPPETDDDLPSLKHAFDKYEREVLPALAPKTQVDYRRALRRLSEVFGHMSPEALLPKHVYQFMTKRPAVAANRDKAVLSAVMTQCVRWGVVDRNLVREVQRNRETPRARYVTDDEVDAFLEHCSEFLTLYVRLKLSTGLRQGQILDLKLSDWDGSVLKGPPAKGGREVHYEGLDELLEEILALRKGRRLRSVFLFSTRNGTQYSSDGFRSIWQRAMAKYLAAGGEKFTDHDLRAKVASDSESLAAAQSRLGHQTPGQTNKVYRRKPEKVTVLKR